MGQFTDDVLAVANLLASRDAAEQGGVISGDNPARYNAADPIRLWVIQVVIIIFMTHGLSMILSRFRQPQVVAEVIGGIILGPTVMGRIPGFLDTIFPQDSMPLLTLSSTIGLLLYLFLIGLEIDVSMAKRTLKASAAISLAGLVIPLGLGAALGVGLYKEFVSPEINFGYFVLFVAVAIGITAFPVLCRILTALNLLETPVGIATLSAGVGNDVVGWVLLALAVALVNASEHLAALWILLSCVGFTLFLLFPVRWVYVWLARRTGSLEQGTPTSFMMTLTMLIVFISAFFTDIIGVHAIFGGFLAGLIIPHENGYAISMVEKIEDLVTILFLPIYFTLSGLKTNLGLLDTGITWGYIVLTCVIAFVSKFFSCAGVAYATGFNWRESGAIGSLMSCKGLVELIVLNIGLQAKILDGRTFSMFVVHALVLTVITTPLTLAFYPPEHRSIHGRAKLPRPGDTEVPPPSASTSGDDEQKTRFTIVLDRTEQLPSAMSLSHLLQPTITSLLSSSSSIENEKAASPSRPPVTFNALRLMELTSRTSAVLRSQEAEALVYNDPIISIFKTFGSLNSISVSAALSVLSLEEFPEAIAKHANDTDSQMVILPWSRGATTIADGNPLSSTAQNPFDGVFHKTITKDQTSSVVYSEFIRNVFLRSSKDVALFVDRGIGLQTSTISKYHIFLPYIGGPDDRLALKFLVQLCANPMVTATVVRLQKADDLTPTSTHELELKVPAAAFMTVAGAGADTVYGPLSTQTRMQSDTADNIAWARYTNPDPSSPEASALECITFSTQHTTKPLRAILDIATQTCSDSKGKIVLVMTGRSRRMAPESHTAELTKLISESGSTIASNVPRTLGDVGAALVATHTPASIIIVQASA